jgi:hypothetical protein
VHVRVIELPASQVATTGPTPDPDPFAPGATLARFDAWFSARTDPLALAPRDLMWQDGGDGPLVWSWLLAPDEDVADAGWAVERFAGGLYAAGVARDGDDADGERVLRELRAWVEASPFDLDESAARPVAFRVTTSPAAARVLGHRQLELLVPVREPA